MIYIDFNKTDNYYEFIDESGGKTIIPSSSVILVDDESGYIAVKLTASRKTIGLLKNTTPPTPPAFTGKWLATYTGGTTSSAECDSTSAITDGEITKTNLAEVEIGNCVTTIGESAFTSCYDLTNIDIPSGVTSIGNYAFANCSGITSIDIPGGVTSIGWHAFRDCSGLTSIDIPDSVTGVAFYAFSNCTSLTSCTIGSGVTYIGMSAFGNCSGLTGVTVNATTPPTLGNYAFDGTNNCPIYVPSGSVSAYQSAFDWSSYRSRITAIP